MIHCALDLALYKLYSVCKIQDCLNSTKYYRNIPNKNKSKWKAAWEGCRVEKQLGKGVELEIKGWTVGNLTDIGK